jgi:hypothetical protein
LWYNGSAAARSNADRNGKGSVKTVGRFFLCARHWKLFLLIFCTGLLGPRLPALVQAFAASGTAREAAGLAGQVLTAVGALGWLAWLGSVGMFLNARNRPAKSGPIRFFQFALIFIGAYLLALDVFVPGSSGLMTAAGAAAMDTFTFLSFYVALPLVTGLCVLYAFYFDAKNLVMAESPGPVGFRGYVGSFALILFFPVGVWFVQPGINRLYAQSREAQAGVQPRGLP